MGKFKQKSNLSKHKKRCKGMPKTKQHSDEELIRISTVARQQFIRFGGKLKFEGVYNEYEIKKKLNDCHIEKKTTVIKSKIEDTNKSKKLMRKIPRENCCKFQCDLCGIEFLQLSALKTHLSLNHRKLLFQCSELNCDKTFNLKGNLVKHISQVHESERKFQCDICGSHLKTKQHLKFHLKVHGEPKECSICKKKLSNIEEHIKRHQQEKKNFKCEHCEKICATKQALQEHIQRIHEKKSLGRWYTCSICAENFIRNIDLRRHSFIHFQGKVYACSYPNCIERFKTSYKLKLHRVIHRESAIKNFVCEICNKSYLRQTALYKHKKQHHLTGKITHI
jgi:uncharacterized Zn-finger protein